MSLVWIFLEEDERSGLGYLTFPYGKHPSGGIRPCEVSLSLYYTSDLLLLSFTPCYRHRHSAMIPPIDYMYSARIHFTFNTTQMFTPYTL